LKISSDTNTLTQVNLIAHPDIYKDFLTTLATPKRDKDTLPDIGIKEDPSTMSIPLGEKEMNPYENSADHPSEGKKILDAIGQGSNKPDLKLDIFHVIYKIDGKEFEDKIPSELNLRV